MKYLALMLCSPCERNLSEGAGRVHLRLRRVGARLEGREPARRRRRGPLSGPGGGVALHHLGRRRRRRLLLGGAARLVVQRGRLVDVEPAQGAVQVVEVGVGI